MIYNKPLTTFHLLYPNLFGNRQIKLISSCKLAKYGNISAKVDRLDQLSSNQMEFFNTYSLKFLIFYQYQ